MHKTAKNMRKTFSQLIQLPKNKLTVTFLAYWDFVHFLVFNSSAPFNFSVTDVNF